MPEDFTPPLPDRIAFNLRQRAAQLRADAITLRPSSRKVLEDQADELMRRADTRENQIAAAGSAAVAQP